MKNDNVKTLEDPLCLCFAFSKRLKFDLSQNQKMLSVDVRYE